MHRRNEKSTEKLVGKPEGKRPRGRRRSKLVHIFKTYSCNIKKVKLSPCLIKHHAMKTYWGSGDIIRFNIILPRAGRHPNWSLPLRYF
jgi:hypothetical protein